MSGMPRSIRPLVIVLATALLGGLLVVTTATPAQAGKYTPGPGVTTNNPLGGKAAKQRINRKLIRSVRSTRPGQTIRVASWNIRNRTFENALIRAHRRGVSVRVVVARGNARASNPNPGVNRLQNALRGWGNKKRKAQRKSGLRRCRSSCRGRRGIAHSKFFVFSKVGNANRVVINGSHNATDTAGTKQWNDIYTVRGRKGLYREYVKVFNQMYRDRPVRQGARIRKFGSLLSMVLPWSGRYTRGEGDGGDEQSVKTHS